MTAKDKNVKGWTIWLWNEREGRGGWFGEAWICASNFNLGVRLANCCQSILCANVDRHSPGLNFYGCKSAKIVILYYYFLLRVGRLSTCLVLFRIYYNIAICQRALWLAICLWKKNGWFIEMFQADVIVSEISCQPKGVSPTFFRVKLNFCCY